MAKFTQGVETESLPLAGADTRTDWRRMAQTAGIGGVAYFFFHCVAIVTGNQKRLMGWLYDDAFYYLVVAKHFSERHISSFDGVTVTSGYHPLWMWLCSAVYGTRGRLDLTYVRLCMGMTICISIALLLAALRENLRKEENGWLWALALGATSYSALNNGVTVMEWPLVILCWALLHRLMMRVAAPTKTLADQWWITSIGALLLGIVGSLSRTDFGLIPACYIGGGILIGLRFRNWTPVRTAAATLAGSVVGLGLVFLYNHAMTGSWLQQSAQVKHMAASLAAPFNPVPAVWQFLRVLIYLPRLDLDPVQRASMLRIGLGFLLPVAFVAVGSAISGRRWLRETLIRGLPSDAAEILASASAFLGVLGYLFVYSLNSQATYGWYSATVTGFVLVLAARVFSLLGSRVCAAVVLPLMLVNISVAEYCGGNARSQYQEVSAGRLMHQDHSGARMGGGDVGKPSFYNDGAMFNLDGLMNNEVIPYLAAGRIHCYILRRHIEYLSDIGSMTKPITDAERARRNESPLPWRQYFIMVEGRDSTGEPASYLRTDFDAIRNSGECPNDLL